MDLKFSYFIDCFTTGMAYLPVTIKMALVSIVLGTILALLIAVIRFYRIRWTALKQFPG